jgi:DNA-binding CsgD family transcriptional regulator
VTPGRSNNIFAGGQRCALVFVSDLTAKPASRTRALRALFGLTPAECRLAARLNDGLELRIVAESVGVTTATARFMLKAIFRKTGSHRQSELIQLFNRLPGEASRSREGVGPARVSRED